VDDGKCTRCGWCEAVCPYDAALVTKPFEGDIELIDTKLKAATRRLPWVFQCLPVKGVDNPPDKKIDVVRDFCTYCGACEKACHVKAIGVRRTKTKHTPVEDTPWAEDWKKAIACLTADDRGRPISRALCMWKKQKEAGAGNYEAGCQS